MPGSPHPGRTANLWKGLAQLAVGLTHLGARQSAWRANPAAARNLGPMSVFADQPPYGIDMCLASSGGRPS